MFTRNRALSVNAYEASHEPCRSKSSICQRLSPMMFIAMVSIWNGVSFSIGGSKHDRLEFAVGLHLRRPVAR